VLELPPRTLDGATPPLKSGVKIFNPEVSFLCGWSGSSEVPRTTVASECKKRSDPTAAPAGERDRAKTLTVPDDDPVHPPIAFLARSAGMWRLGVLVSRARGKL
jgi:hypothetical protein